jgi:hypothetical protein
MPRAWSDKDERQYEHIKQAEEERGEPRAEEIAARTVNKQRAREGRTQEQKQNKARSSRTSRSGDKTRDELYNEAKKLGVKGRSKMNKQQLEAAVRRAR